MSLLTRVKIKVLRVLGAFTQIRCRLRGMTCGKHCFIDGMPQLRLAKGSRVQLGDDVTLISNPRHNPLLQNPMSIHTLLPDAEVTISAHAGLSGCRIVCCNRVSIGEYTIVGPDTVIYDSKGHDYCPEEGWRGRLGRHGLSISIGSRCLLGMRCIILKGVTIGDRCVISAGTVVNKDVPSGHIAFGNPMQISPLPEKYTH